MTGYSEIKRKQKVQWPEEAEQKLIEVWADILNAYVEDELPTGLQHSAEEVLAKIDNVFDKARRFYDKFPRQKETWLPARDNGIAVDVEVASLLWPIFQTFYDVLGITPL